MPVRAGLIALVALVAAGGCRESGRRRWVNLEKNAQGVRRDVPFWTSSASMQACLREGMKRLDAGVKAADAFEGGQCAEGRIGDVPHRTPVELLLPASSQCEPLARVRVASGLLKGKVGCLPPEVLSDHPIP